MDKNLLRSFMALHGDTNKTLSEALGVSPQRFSMKLNEREGAEFTQSEITSIKRRYSLTPKEVDEVFFALKVSKLDTA